MDANRFLLVLLVVAFRAVMAQDFGVSSVSASAVASTGGATVDLRHHWQRPYSYGYGNNYYGGYAYPSYYDNSGYGSYNSYSYPSNGYYNNYQSYQQYYPYTGYGYGNSYYGNSYGNYFGLGYREGNKDAVQQGSAVTADSDAIKFN